MRRIMYRLFNRLRFKQKLVLSYCVVIVIPILVLGIYSYNQSTHLLGEQARQAVDRNAAAVAENLNYKIERFNSFFNIVLYNGSISKIIGAQYSDYSNLARKLNDVVTPFFHTVLSLNKEISEATIYTKNQIPEYGNIIASSERVEKESWYQKAMRDGKTTWYFEQGQLFAAGKFPTLFSEAHNSVLYMGFYEKDMFATVDQLLGDYGVLIADRQGEVVYANGAASGVNMHQMPDESNAVTVINGEQMIVIRKEIPHAGWTFYCFVPINAVSKDAGSILGATLVVIGICLHILLIIVSIFANTMLRRIHLLNGWMKRAEEGELDLYVHTVSQDEIGQLTSRFGNMLRRVNELITEVYQKEVRQKEAELQALRWQINPHFLYNTLSFINWKAVDLRADDISYMVTTLSKFYRTALNHGETVISVRDELENIRSYLDIMLIMSDYSFDVIYDVDERAESYWMINLILQPLVENAIKHGVKKKVGEARGEIQISVRVTGDVLHFGVADNGPGMDAETVSTIFEIHSGYGLRSVRERIKLFFDNDDYGIAIRSSLGEGTVMTVTIPLRTRQNIV